MKTYRILIVEDDAIIASYLASSLEEWGHSVTALALKGSEALDAAARERPDLALLDIEMEGGMDGIETATRLGEKYGVPVIYLTAHSNEDLIERAKETGPYGYILKPYRPQELRIAIEMAMKRHDVESRLAETNERLAREVEERRRSEKDLLVRDIAIFNSINGIALTDPDGTLTYVNSSFLDMWGYSDEAEVLGRNAVEFWQDSEEPKAVIEEEKRTGGWVGEMKAVRRDGTIFDAQVAASAVMDGSGTVISLMGSFIDITERKLADETLRESEMLLAMSQRIAHVGSWRLDVASGRLTWSEEVYRIFGIEPTGSPVTYEAFLDAVYPEDRAAVDSAYHESLLHGTDSYEIDHRIVRGDTGEIRNVHERCIHVRDSSGRITGSIGMVQDITERKKAEDALRKSEGSVRRKLTAVMDPEGDIGELELADIIDHPALQSLMDDFYRITNIGVAIVDMRGRLLVATGWQDICTKFHRVNQESRANCIESDLRLSEGVPAGEYRIYRCRNNMWDIATPIQVGGKKVGNLFLGQFFFEGEEPDVSVFRDQANRYGFDPEEYLEALSRVPRWKRETVDAVMAFYGRLVGLISSMSHSVIKLARAKAERETLLAQIKDSEEKYRDLVERINDVIFKVREDGVITFLSGAAESMFGYIPGEIEGRNFSEFIHEDDLASVRLSFGEVLAGAVYPKEYRIRHASGGFRWVRSTNRPYYENGRAAGLVGVMSDISERKRAEEELTSVNRRLTATLNALPDLMFEVDAGGRILDFRSQKDGLLYLPPDQFLGKTVDEVLPEDAAGIIKGALAEAAATGRHGGAVYSLDMGGGARWFELSVAACGEPGAEGFRLVALSRDISPRKRAEVALAESERRYRLLYENAPIGIFTTNSSGGVHSVNTAMARMLGLHSPEQAVTHYTDLGAQLYASPERRKKFVEILRERGSVSGFEYEARTADDRTVWLSMNARVAQDEHSGGFMIEGFTTDITDRKRAEEALSESEERYRALVENARAVVLQWDTDGVIRFINDYAEKFFGYSREELIGQNVVGTIVPSTESSGRNLAALLADIGRDPELYRDNENENMTSSGRRVWVRWSNRAVLDARGNLVGVISIGNDETARRWAEETLRTSEQRLATLVANLPGFIYRRANDSDWTMEFISDGCRAVTGYSPEDFMGDGKPPFSSIVRTDFRETLRSQWQECLDSGNAFEHEYPIVNATGETRWVWERGRGIFRDDGSLLCLEGFITDVTERFLAEESLRASRELFQSVFNGTPIMMCVVDRDRTVVRGNRAFREATGWPDPESGSNLACGVLGCVNALDDPRGCGHGPACGDCSLFNAIERTFADGRERTGIERMLTVERNGRREDIYLLASSTLLPPEGGDLLLLCLQDISDRALAEQSLVRAMTRFALLSRTSGELLETSDPRGLVSSLCARVMEHLDCQAFFNYMAEPREGRLRLNAFAGIPDDEARRIEWIDYGDAVCGYAARDRVRVVAGNIQASTDERTELVRSYGITAYACHPLLGEGGDVIGTLSFGTRTRGAFSEEDLDLMKAVAALVAAAMIRIRHDEALRASEDKYRSLFTEMVSGFAIHEMLFNDDGSPLDYRFLEVNPKFYDLTGFGEIVGRTAREVMPGIDQYWIDIYGKVVTHRESVTYENFASPLGRWYEVRAFPAGGARFATVFHDITERKLAETALAESEEKYRMVADYTDDWEYWFRPDGYFFYISPSCENITGYGREEFIRDPGLLHNMIHEEDRDDFMSHERKMMAGERSDCAMFRIVTKGGEVRWLGHRCRIVLSNDGEHLGVRVSNRDITFRIRAAETIAESEAKFHTLFTGSGDAQILMDGDLVVDGNEAALSMLGCREREDLLGRRLMDFCPEIQPDGAPSADKARALRKRAIEERNVRFEWQLRRRDGELYYAEVVLTAITIEGRPMLHATIRDVTERRLLQQRIITIVDEEQQRLGRNLHDGLGQDLTGTAFMCNSLAKRLGELNLKEKDRAEEITRQVYGVITKVRALSRELYPPNLVENEIAFTLEDFASNVEKVFGITCRYKQDPGIVVANIHASTQIYYIVREAVHNAIRHGKARRIIIRLTGSRDRVRLLVKDNGAGMPGDSAGGLGLKIMKYRMESVYGTFTIRRNRVRGTSVVCEIPRHVIGARE